MKKIVLFGTGRELNRHEGYLKMVGLEVDYYTDNNAEKWGTKINGKKVLHPQELVNLDCYIYISCNFYDEIKTQLQDMGIEHKLMNYQNLFRLIVNNRADQYLHEERLIDFKDTEQVLIDAFDGIGWGGMEIWSYHVGLGLKSRGYDITIYGSDWQVPQEGEIEDLVKRYYLDRDDFWKTVQPIILDMEKKLPFVLLNNWTEHVFAAAYVIKRKYPDKVRILSFVHNDWDALYEKQVVWNEWEEKIAGVSKRINQNLENVYKIPSAKIFYKENFISKFAKWNPANREPDAPINIGWGARLEVFQKRADLLLVIIECLNRLFVNYILNIAGNGPFITELKKYVEKNSLAGRVNILGELKPEQMGDFWRKQHLYLNLSDFEGSSLAMLEAISNGAVPVVTDVSGTDEFIENGRSGYRIPVGDTEGIVTRIIELYKNEPLRRKMAVAGRRMVETKCQVSDYISYIEGMINEKN